MKLRKFICTGCGDDRPCILETNQEASPFDYMTVEDLKCVLDETNQTSYNWVERATKPDTLTCNKCGATYLRGLRCSCNTEQETY